MDRQATRPPFIRLLVFCLGDTPARACREAAAESQHPPQFRYRWNTGWILRRTTRVGDAQNNLTCPSIIRRYSGGRLHRSPHQGGREREIKSFHRFLPRHRDLCTYHDEGERERSEEHTSELQSLMRISYAVFCLKKKKQTMHTTTKQ